MFLPIKCPVLKVRMACIIYEVLISDGAGAKLDSQCVRANNFWVAQHRPSHFGLFLRFGLRQESDKHEKPNKWNDNAVDPSTFWTQPNTLCGSSNELAHGQKRDIHMLATIQSGISLTCNEKKLFLPHSTVFLACFSHSTDTRKLWLFCELAGSVGMETALFYTR